MDPAPAAAPPPPPPAPAPAAPPAPAVPPPPVKFDYPAALLSYLVPGLGQVYQGRIAKGLMFFAGLYVLFFWGMSMGQGKNVWLPDPTHLPAFQLGPFNLTGAQKALAYRPQFLAQACIGVAAWPALYQYARTEMPVNADVPPQPSPMFGTFMQAPNETQLNDLQRKGNKLWDLGWVYTVIAGVLNLLVIYDALAGPLFRDAPAKPEDHEPEGVS